MKIRSQLLISYLLLTISVLLLGSVNNLQAQTTWTGSLGTNWNEPNNWSAGIPDAADVVTIPNVANKPVLSTAAVAKLLSVSGGATLTITLAGTLSINGGSIWNDVAFYNAGTVFNGGTINIGSTAEAGYYGIQNYGTFTNQGTININRVRIGINSLASFTNEGIISIGGLADISYWGMYLEGTYSMFNNKAGAILNIDRTGTVNSVGEAINATSNVTIYNQGTINLGSLASVGTIGIKCLGTFNNQPGGQINIDRANNAGIDLYYGTFNNQSTINIGANAPMTNLMTGDRGILNNQEGGIIKGTGNLPSQISNTAGTLAPGYSPGKMTFTGDETFGTGSLAIEVNSNGTAGTDFDQVVVNGKATLGGTLALSINYAGANGHQIPILTASEVSGTFASITGLQPNWFINYTSNAVYLTYCSTPFSVFSVTGSGSYSCGGNGLAVGLSGSQVGVNYQLQKNGINYASPLPGTGAAISFGNQTKGTYTVVATAASGGCTAMMPGKAVISEACLHAALNFDGANDFVALPNALATAMTSQPALTIEYWFKGTNLTSAVRAQTGGSYIIAGFDNKHIISTDGGAAGIAVGAAATDGNWHHIAMTWQKNTVNGFKSYLDGQLVEQRNAANVNLPVLNAGLFLGSNGGSTEFMNGSLDEVRIWNVARTSCQIQSNYKAELTLGEPGLLAYYKFNQGIVGESNPGVTSLTDASGNNYTGTLSNFALTGTSSTWISPGGVVTGSTNANTWLGITSNWNTASNWSTGAVPGECTRVIINGGVPFMPTVSGLNNSCFSVTVNNGGRINMATGANLNITGK